MDYIILNPENNQFEIEHFHYNPFHPYKNNLGGIKIIDYICIQEENENEFIASLKMRCINTSLEHDFDIRANLKLKVNSAIDENTNINIGIVLYNYVIDEILEQDKHSWIKNGLIKNPNPNLIKSVLRCPQ